jgi:hypothetical protein
MMNYAVSSADIGLVLYDRESPHETNNGITAGKIGTYLKNGLPLIAGSAENLRVFEEQGIGNFWDGKTEFDEVACRALGSLKNNQANIPAYYRTHLQYEVFFSKFLSHLRKSIH